MSTPLESSRISKRSEFFQRLLKLVQDNSDCLTPDEAGTLKAMSELTEMQSAADSSEADTSQENWNAYVSEHAALLQAHPDWFVAYCNGNRIALEPTREAALECVANQKVSGIVMVQQIVPEESESLYTIGSPRLA